METTKLVYYIMTAIMIFAVLGFVAFIVAIVIGKGSVANAGVGIAFSLATVFLAWIVKSVFSGAAKTSEGRAK